MRNTKVKSDKWTLSSIRLCTVGLMLLFRLGFAERASALDDEHERLNAWRKNSAALVQVAVFDECLLLSSDQRRRFCELLNRPASDAWWRSARTPPMLDTTTSRLFDMVSERRLGGFLVPDADLTDLLTPAQWAAFKLLREPMAEQIVLEGKMASGVAEHELAASRGVEIPLKARMIHRGPPLGELQSRLTRCFELRLGEIDSICRLTADQRAKLLLAGTIDMARCRDQWSPPRGPETAANRTRIEVRGAVAPLPLFMLSDAGSFFQKSLRARLLGDQSEKLSRLDHEQRMFRRDALIAAIVARLQQYGSLFYQQREALSNVLVDELADVDSQPNSPLDWLRQIGHLPPERLRPLFLDVQWAILSPQLTEVLKLADEFEAQQRAGVFGPPRVRGDRGYLISLEALSD